MLDFCLTKQNLSFCIGTGKKLLFKKNWKRWGKRRENWSFCYERSVKYPFLLCCYLIVRCSTDSLVVVHELQSTWTL